ncbi:hypothetical protein ElyMa_002112900 [Elysia marginata]|uniref:Uncharacterized protein n=1 Tax=Elysia marginata TaxID=1093978 RepID=A0AAV4FG49_9GAST|nr:hypothetical protein ElyMa_002112900 [Elysia marginata]
MHLRNFALRGLSTIGQGWSQRYEARCIQEKGTAKEVVRVIVVVVVVVIQVVVVEVVVVVVVVIVVVVLEALEVCLCVMKMKSTQGSALCSRLL